MSLSDLCPQEGIPIYLVKFKQKAYGSPYFIWNQISIDQEQVKTKPK